MKKLLFFITFITLLCADAKEWLNLETGDVERVDFSGKSSKLFGSDLMTLRDGAKTKRYMKLERSGALFAEVFLFENGKSVPAGDAEAMLISLDDDTLMFQTRSDSSGAFSFEPLISGEYRLKIVKDKRRFTTDLHIAPWALKKRFYPRAEDESNFYILSATKDIIIDKGLEYGVELILFNNGKRSENVCLDFAFDKSLIKGYKIEKQCVMLERRKSIPLSLKIELNQISSEFEKMRIGVSIDNKKEKWRDYLEIPLLYKTQKASFAAGERDTHAYIITPDNEVKKFESGAESIEFPAYPLKEYRVVVASMKKEPLFEIDIAQERNISGNIKKSTASDYPFVLKRSIYNKDIGRVLEYSFKVADSILMDEDSKEIAVPVKTQGIHKAMLDNPRLARVELKGGALYIKPYRDSHGSSKLSLYTRNSSGKEVVKKEIFVSVKNLNDAPVIIFEPKRFVRLGEYYSYNFEVFDADGDPVSKEVVRRPKWLRYDQASGELSGIVGHDVDNMLVLKASDGKTEVLKSIHFAVTGEKKRADFMKEGL